ncbi:hypothetical protein ACTHGU_05280 [Chitinophagaceae bacterium MMS25-I14]
MPANQLVKRIAISACCLFIAGKASAQATQEDIALIKTIYKEENAKIADSQSVVVYLYNSDPWEGLVKILHRQKVWGRGKDTTSLTDDDWKQLLLQMKKYPNFVWPEDLFLHPRRLKGDIHAYYNSLRKTKDSNNREAYRVHIFSKPLYIRNGTVAVTGYALAYVLTDCAFYKKENGRWVKWITISSGVF